MLRSTFNAASQLNEGKNKTKQKTKQTPLEPLKADSYLLLRPHSYPSPVPLWDSDSFLCLRLGSKLREWGFRSALQHSYIQIFLRCHTQTNRVRGLRRRRRDAQSLSSPSRSLRSLCHRSLRYSLCHPFRFQDAQKRGAMLSSATTCRVFA